jgi:hypothetical protein
VERYEYMGCYRDTGQPALLTEVMEWWNSALRFCATRCPYPTYKYFGLGSKDLGDQPRCWCGGRLESTPVASTACTRMCNLGGGVDNCGGDYSLSTYQWKGMPDFCIHSILCAAHS